MGAVLQVAKIKVRERWAGMVASFAAIYGDEVAGVPHARNGIEQCGTDPTKDGAVGGDAEGESQHRHQRKAGRLQEHAQGVTDVLNQLTIFRVEKPNRC